MIGGQFHVFAAEGRSSKAKQHLQEVTDTYMHQQTVRKSRSLGNLTKSGGLTPAEVGAARKAAAQLPTFASELAAASRTDNKVGDGPAPGDTCDMAQQSYALCAAACRHSADAQVPARSADLTKTWPVMLVFS